MKKLLIFGSIAAFFLYRFGKNKLIDFNATLQDLAIDVTSVKNISLQSNSVHFDVDINLTNKSATPLSIKTFGAIVLRRIIFKDHNDVLIGESFPNISNIEIVPGQTITIPNVPTQLPIKNIGLALNTVLNTLANVHLLKITAELETPAGIFLIND